MPDGTHLHTHLLRELPPLAPASLDPEARSVLACIASDAPVRRAGPSPDGAAADWLEVLPPEAADLRRFPVPLLCAHRQEIDAQVGIVADPRVEGGELIASLVFEQTAEADPVFARVAAGTLRNVSIAAAVTAWERRPDEGGLAVYAATRWEPHEVSIVAVAADHNATTRSYPAMPDTSAPAPATDPRHAAEIQRLAARAGTPPEIVGDLILRGLHAEEARREILDDLIARRGIGAGPRPQHVDAVHVIRDGGEHAATAAAEAIRCKLTNRPATGAAAEYAGLRMLDIARAAAPALGINTRRWTADSAATFLTTRGMGMTTSDLPSLLGDAAGKALLDHFRVVETPLKRIARRATANDFRPQTRVRLGAGPSLELVNEAGEVSHGPIAEAAETYALATYARIFSLSRQAIINDDLAAFSDVLRFWAAAAAEREATTLLAALRGSDGAGPTMSDNEKLFAAAHGNHAGSGAAISVTSVGAGRAAMRKQTAPGGGVVIGAAPKFLLCGPDVETVAEQFVSTLYPAVVEEGNPFAGRLEVAVEPRLPGNDWYLMADPAASPVIEFSYLSTAPGPQLSQREGFDTLGVEWRLLIDFGAAAVDWRGGWFNPGA